MQHSQQLHGPAPRPSCTRRTGAWARCCADAGVKIFQIETTLNTDTFPDAVRLPAEARVGVERRGTGRPSSASAKSLDRMPRPGWPARSSTSIEAPHQMTCVQAGEVEAVHEVTTENVLRASSSSRSRARPTSSRWACPYICPYNVNSIMNPILVMCLGLGYFFNLYRGKPLVREGGVLIMTPPDAVGVPPGAPPELHRLLRAGAGRDDRPARESKQYEKHFAEDEWYRHLYRTSYAYHGVHPFYMWYWGAHALQHLGRVIIVGGDPKAVRRLGFTPASTLDDALEMATDVVGRSPTITHLHNPPILHGRRDVSDDRRRPSPDRAARAAARRRAGRARRRPGRRAGPQHRASRSGRRPCPAASRCPPSRRRSAPTTTPTGPARPPPASPAALLAEGPMRLAVRGARRTRGRRASTASTTSTPRRRRRPPPPVIFAANHHSHLDTPLLLTSLPEPWRTAPGRRRRRRLLLRQPLDGARCRRCR